MASNVELNRLRWRSRRGLLENELVLEVLTCIATLVASRPPLTSGVQVKLLQPPTFEPASSAPEV